MLRVIMSMRALLASLAYSQILIIALVFVVFFHLSPKP
jgi:uncharacterized membrane protein